MLFFFYILETVVVYETEDVGAEKTISESFLISILKYIGFHVGKEDNKR